MLSLLLESILIWTYPNMDTLGISETINPTTECLKYS